jgi:hypothetical protein
MLNSQVTWSSIILNNVYADILDKAYNRYKIEHKYHMTFLYQDYYNIYRRNKYWYGYVMPNKMVFNIFYHDRIKFILPENLIEDFKIYLCNKLTNFKKVFCINIPKKPINNKLDYDDAVTISLLSKKGLYADTIFLIYQYFKPTLHASINNFINKLKINDDNVEYEDFKYPLTSIITKDAEVREQIINNEQYMKYNDYEPELNRKIKNKYYKVKQKKVRSRKKEKPDHVMNRDKKYSLLYDIPENHEGYDLDYHYDEIRWKAKRIYQAKLKCRNLRYFNGHCCCSYC